MLPLTLIGTPCQLVFTFTKLPRFLRRHKNDIVLETMLHQYCRTTPYIWWYGYWIK